MGIFVINFSGGVFLVTINSASCEQVDVKVAIGSAISGDIVLVPAGECVWEKIFMNHKK